MDLFGPPPTVGVELGRRTIKVAAVRGGTPPRLAHATVRPTPEGTIDGGAIRNPQALAAALRAALRSAGIRRGRAVLGIGGRTALVRTLSLPPMPEDELKNAVKWEAERHLPLRIEEAVLDAQVMREVSEDGQRHLEVLMAAVPERDALLYHQVARDAGLDVAAIEVSSLALARTLADTNGLTAAVDIGADATEIVITHRTLPPVCRSLPVGGDHLLAQLQPSAAAAAPEGGADVAPPADFAAGQHDTRAVGPAGTPGRQDLLDGLARSIDYFQAQMHREKVERVVLTGEGVQVPGVAQMLAAELAVPVEVGDPLSRLAVPSAVLGRLREHRVVLAVAIGLALRTLH